MNHGGLWVCSHRSCLRTQARRSGWFAASCASLWRARRAMQNPPPPPPPRSRGGTPRRQAPGCARSSFSHSPYRRPLSVSRQRPLSAPLSAQLLLSPCGGLPPDSTRQSFMARSHPLWVPRPARSRANSGSGTGRGFTQSPSCCCTAGVLLRVLAPVNCSLRTDSQNRQSQIY